MYYSIFFIIFSNFKTPIKLENKKRIRKNFNYKNNKIIIYHIFLLQIFNSSIVTLQLFKHLTIQQTLYHNLIHQE